MLSKAVLGSTSLLALLVLAGPAWAQDREDDLGTGRTEAPTPAPGGTGRTTRPTSGGGRTDVPVDPGSGSRTPPPSTPQEQNKGDRAPWAWPWGGARSPEWTQDANWTTVHFWMMDVGHIELDMGWNGTIARRNYDLDQSFKPKARIGLLPFLELDVAEEFGWDWDGRHLRDYDRQLGERAGNHVTQVGNEIGGRLAFWEYGKVPLNPSIEMTWRPRHNGVDQWEGRASIGFELFPNLVLAADGFFQGETAGQHHYTWGFHAGATYELFPHVLRVGAEGGITWQFSPDHQDPFKQTDPEAGPTVVFRPLALMKPEYGNLLKITMSSQFGLRDDNTNVPFCRALVIIGTQF